MYTYIASALLNKTKTHKLGLYFEMEEKIIGIKQSLEKIKINDLLNDSQAGTLEDKIRLFTIYYICSKILLLKKLHMKFLISEIHTQNLLFIENHFKDGFTEIKIFYLLSY
jgi:hypothetical protein